MPTSKSASVSSHGAAVLGKAHFAKTVCVVRAKVKVLFTLAFKVLGQQCVQKAAEWILNVMCIFRAAYFVAT